MSDSSLTAGAAPFAGNINFNAQHSPMGAFMSFTCGHFGSGGGIGVEIGKPAGQGLFVGIKQGERTSTAPLRCLPFLRSGPGSSNSAANYDVEHSQASSSPTAGRRSYENYPAEQLQRHYGWGTDRWTTPDLCFTIYTPFGPIPDPAVDSGEALRNALLPAVVATLEVDNRNGGETKTAVFAIDFVEPGTRLLPGNSVGGDAGAGESTRLGFGWRRSMGVMGMVEGAADGDRDRFFALQRWSVAEGLSDANPVHGLGSCGGLALEVPAGQTRTIVLAIGVYLDAIATTRLEGRYFYTRHYSGLDDVLATALQQSRSLRRSAIQLDQRLASSGLSADQQFLLAHATRSYYGSTQLLEMGGEPFWVVNEGEYCMMNTLDLSVDQAFWELRHNPWVVRNLLVNFARHYAYHDEVKGRAAQMLPGGISFAHDMGVNNHFAPAGRSSYELAHLNGCFSFMTQEQLCNWILTAACYVTRTADADWLLQYGHVLAACGDSLRARAHPQTGVMAYDSSLCAGGQEITTYDSLDESLGQSRANTYLAVKCWASWLGLELLEKLRIGSGGEPAGAGPNLAEQIAAHLIDSVGSDGTVPAVLESNNAGNKSRILPIVEGLVYPAYWLQNLGDWTDEASGRSAVAGQHGEIAGRVADARAFLQQALSNPMTKMLGQHTRTLLADPRRRNLFEDGGIKLSSTSSNSWMSKIALFQHIVRSVLRLTESDPVMARQFAAADAAHVKWQTDGSGFWACSDQFIDGVAKGSRYYPRIVTAVLWLDETERGRRPDAASAATAPLGAAGADVPRR